MYRHQQSSLYWDGTPQQQVASPPPSQLHHHRSPSHQSPPPEKESNTAIQKGLDADRSIPAETFPVTYALIKSSSQPDNNTLGSILEADAVSAGYVGAVLDELRRFIDFHESQSTTSSFSSTTTTNSTQHNRVLREDLVVSKRISAALGGATARSVSARQELRDMVSHRAAQLQQVEECIRVVTLAPHRDPLHLNI